MADYPYAHHCEKCGKEVFPTAYWTYKRGGKYYCSWKCFNQGGNRKSKKEIIIPKVGDTIRIISVYGLSKYANKTGVVKSIDYLGQIHGTWGTWQLIPGQDVYEIIGESNEQKIL